MSARLLIAAVLTCFLLLPRIASAAAPPYVALAKRAIAEKAIERQLQTRINLSFIDIPLRDVVEELRTVHGLNIVVDNNSLAEAGISLDSRVTMKLDKIPLRTALQHILQQIKLAYVIDGQVLRITTQYQQEIAGDPVTASYPVASLVDRMTQKELIDLITRCLAPRSWKAQGGPCTIDYCPSTRTLRVVQTVNVHEQITDLIASLRALEDTDPQKLLPAK